MIASFNHHLKSSVK